MPRIQATAQRGNYENFINETKTMRKIFPLTVPTIPTIKCEVFVCGTGDVGQLGLGPDRMEAKRPVKLQNINDAVDICAGGMHTLVLTSDGSVFSFGCNDEGALGRDSSEEDSEYEPHLVDLPSKAVMVTAGDSHSACLLENGTVMAWGSFRDSHGNMGLTKEGNKRVPHALLPDFKCYKIASGADHLVILTTNGHVYTVGCAEQGQLGRIAQRSSSGDGRRGKTDFLRVAKVNIPRLKSIHAIWATNYCTFISESTGGRIFAFGLNNYKQLVYNTDKEIIFHPILIDISNVKTIAGGQHHTMILKNNGTIHVVGRRDYGRLGLGEINMDIEKLTPLDALKDLKIVDICCGESTSFAITDKGELYVWGFGSNNQLGTGSENDVLVPQRVKIKSAENKPIIRVASGGQHSVFLVSVNCLNK